MTGIWGLAHRPNLDRVLLCWGGLGGGSRRPSYITILYVALHLTQLLPDLKQGGVGLCKYPSGSTPTLHTHTDPVGGTADAPNSQSPYRGPGLVTDV